VNGDAWFLSAIIVGLCALAFEFFTAPHIEEFKDDGDERPDDAG
jgi:hypothetical protein